METFRCPTCVSVLVDPTVRRCPSCHTKLRKRRAKPIILGESSRLDNKLTPFDVAMRARMESERTRIGIAVARDAAPAPAPIASPPVVEHEPVIIEHEPVIEPEIETPEIEIIAELAPLPEPEPDPVQVIAPEPEPEPVVEERAPSPLDGTLNEMLDELFRKARADSDE